MNITPKNFKRHHLGMLVRVFAKAYRMKCTRNPTRIDDAMVWRCWDDNTTVYIYNFGQTPPKTFTFSTYCGCCAEEEEEVNSMYLIGLLTIAYAKFQSMLYFSHKFRRLRNDRRINHRTDLRKIEVNAANHLAKHAGNMPSMSEEMPVRTHLPHPTAAEKPFCRFHGELHPQRVGVRGQGDQGRGDS